MTQSQAAEHPAIDLMRAHRSIRTFTDEPVSREAIEAAVRAGQTAATSSSVQAYCCIRVTDPAHRDKLAELAGPQDKVKLAPEFFVICGDARRHRIACEMAGGAYDQKLEGFMISVIDAALFAQNMVLAFEAMGFGTCYIGGLRNDVGRVIEVLGLLSGVYPVFGLCVGRPAEAPTLRPRFPVESVLFEGAYPDDSTITAQLNAYDAGYREYLRQRGAPEQTVNGSWSGAMASKLGKVARPALAGVYRAQGAVLD